MRLPVRADGLFVTDADDVIVAVAVQQYEPETLADFTAVHETARTIAAALNGNRSPAAEMRQGLVDLLLWNIEQAVGEGDGDPGFDGQITMAREVVDRCAVALGVSEQIAHVIDLYEKMVTLANKRYREDEDWDSRERRRKNAMRFLQRRSRRALGVPQESET